MELITYGCNYEKWMEVNLIFRESKNMSEISFHYAKNKLKTENKLRGELKMLENEGQY